MSHRFLAFAVLIASCASGASSASAQGGTRSTQPPRTTEPTPAASTAADGDARTLFTLGQSAFSEGRVEAALEYFQRAYDLSHRPELLFNIGHAADRLRDDRRALAAFEGFLRDVPDSPQRASTEVRVEVLRRSIATTDEAEARERSLLATQVSTERDHEHAAVRRRHAVGWAVAGAGLASLAVGTTFVALGVNDQNTVERARDGTTFSSVEAAYERASTRVTIGLVLLGVGAAAGATGLALVLRGGASSDDSAALSLHVLPNGFLVRRAF